MTKNLILGGARSGKSDRALSLAHQFDQRVFIATAEAHDEEMAERIARHRIERGDDWVTVEAPRDLAGAIRDHAASEAVLLIDCLTLWLSNIMLAEMNMEAETEALMLALGAAPGRVVMVSNEVGMGLVPETPLGRRFRDAQGRLNRRVAAMCDRVEFVAAGLPLVLKGDSGQAPR